MIERFFYGVQTYLILLCCFGIIHQSSSQGDGTSGDSPCAISITRSITTDGDIRLCYESEAWLSQVVVSCIADKDGYQANGDGGRSSCMTVPCCTSSGSTTALLIVSWRGSDNYPCWKTVRSSCCVGPDSDGDGICDEEDCWPDDGSLSHAPYDSCDDGDPNTYGDYYNENCKCVGDPDEGCLTGSDSDGDGVCDDEDCDPNDPAQTHTSGDYCNDGNPATYNDQYDDNCNCVGEPLPCGDVDPDDGCPLTTDGVDANCNIINTPPDPDDGCPLTYDYFDAVNCVIVNEVPEVDDGCDLTYDYFDAANCLIINVAPEVDDDCEFTMGWFDNSRCRIMYEPLPCDDGNPETFGDEYNEDCECIGYDPCEIKMIEWQKVLSLLRDN